MSIRCRIWQVELGKKVKIPIDGNWFTVSFDAVEVKQNRLVISAQRIPDGLVVTPHKQYIVEFKDTRAAYLRGFYEQHNPRYGWPYIHWDIRSYAKHPHDPNLRVYVQGFHAHDELRKLISTMEATFGVSNVFNSYIKDNLLRFQMGIQMGKTPQEIEKTWSKGMMESLGYHHIECFDTGRPAGKWTEVKVHWCKRKQDLKS